MVLSMWRSDNTRQNLVSALQHNDTIVVFDLETTGFSPVKNHVIQLAAQKIKVENGKFRVEEEFNTYINPGYSLPPKIVEVTGITDEVLFNAPCEEDIFDDICNFFSGIAVVCGYNVSFDIEFMKEMYMRRGLSFEFDYVLDILEMARDIVPKSETSTHKLGVIAALYGVDAGLTFHNAMDDVIATARLLQVFACEYNDVQATSIKVVPKKQARIYSMRYWEGYRGKSRIYIQTNLGSFYYDIMSQSWDKKPDNPNDLKDIDMEQLRADAFRIANATNEKEFARYRN